MTQAASTQPRSFTRSLIDAILSTRHGLPIVLRSQRSLATVNSYIEELEAKCTEQRRMITEKDKLIDEMSDITTDLLMALRERGTQVEFGPVVEGKATWTLVEHGKKQERKP